MNSTVNPVLFDRTIRILKWMVAADTTTSTGIYRSNNAHIAEIADYLKVRGIKSQIIPTKSGKSSNLFARLGGPDKPNGIVLSGHVDVVPSDDPAKWTSNPFKLTERNGLLYGRGVADMKGYCAGVLAMAEDYQAMDLQTPVYALFTGEEEIGCQGMIPVLEHFKATGFDPNLVIIGEPTDNMVVFAHNGRVLIDLHSWGTGGHSSQRFANERRPGKTNAVETNVLIAACMLCDNKNISRALGENGALGNAAFSLTNPGTGLGSNVLLGSHTFGFDVRGRPGLTRDDVNKVLQPYVEQGLAQARASENSPARASRLDIRVTSPGFRCDNPATTDLIMQLMNTKRSGVIEFNTEACRFWECDMGGVVSVCGPGRPDQAHMVDEYLEPYRLLESLHMLRRVGRLARSSRAFT